MNGLMVLNDIIDYTTCNVEALYLNYASMHNRSYKMRVDDRYKILKFKSHGF